MITSKNTPCSNRKKLPNFLIVGAPRCGTTSLYYYCKQHPEIYMSEVKEPGFFASDEIKALRQQSHDLGIIPFIDNEQTYVSLFNGVKNEKATGEATSHYLFFEKAAYRIQAYLTDPKIVIILRNPMNRAFSAYLQAVRDNRENLSFDEAIDKHPYYIDVGFYYRQVKRYMDLFHNVHVILFEEFIRDPLSEIQKVYTFLGVESDFMPDLEVFEESGVPKNRFVYNLLMRPNLATKGLKRFLEIFIREEKLMKLINNIRRTNLEKKYLDEDTRGYLAKFYREDILSLQELLKFDVSHWLS